MSILAIPALHPMVEKIIHKKDPRILITRTDRIGDVLLSTPVFAAIKRRYPNAYVAAMVLPYTADLLRGNPDIDEIIVYDKRNRHKQWWHHGELLRMIRSRKFDYAVHLHPTNRVHWISFLSTIPVRIGYERKCPFLLTHKIAHIKHLGERHESAYNFDLLTLIDVPLPDELVPRVYLTKDDTDAFDAVCAKHNINMPENIFVINPGASCPSKMWPAERFAELANIVSQKYKVQPVIVGDRATKAATDRVKEVLKVPFIDCSEERLTLRLLAVLFARAHFLISNDTGLVHLASAVDLPLISIFGRADKGLGPGRWGPLGRKSLYVHKPEPCTPCKAHNCQRGFKCLTNIGVNDILDLLESHREMFLLS